MSTGKKLKDVLPYEFNTCEYEDSPVRKHLEREVLEVVEENDKRFPFTHKNIYVWWILEDGYAVGWNESPSRGWSFPLKRLKREYR